MNKRQPPAHTYKAMLWDYDYLLAKSDEECCYSLSEREVQIILAIVDYIAWDTRYKPTETTIDKETILNWQGNLARKLMSGCCPDEGQLSRFNASGVFQTSDDGGETWTDNPDADPRNKAIASPPLTGTGDSTKCAAADNIRDQFQSYRDSLVDILNAGEPVTAILAFIVGLIGFFLGLSGVAIGISVLLLGLAWQLFTQGAAALTAAVDTTALDEFRCILYCRAENNGQFTYAGWQAVLTDIAANFDGLAELFFYQTVASMGYIGLSNAGTVGVATAVDCGGCDCGCGEGCTFAWTGDPAELKPPVPGWTFSNPDCDVSPTYRCIPINAYANYANAPGECTNKLRYSIARSGGSTSVSIDILINGTEEFHDPLTGMATNGTPQVNREFVFPQPLVVNTVRFTARQAGGTNGGIYMREVDFGVCLP